MAEYGLQLYSVRDITKENLKDALRQVAEMGYKYVEFAGFFGNPAEDVKAWLDEYGLKVSGTHTGCAEITPTAIKATIAYHKAIGCTNLIVPGAVYGTSEELEYTIALLNYAEKRLAKEGITLGYHNHSKELYKAPHGKVVDAHRGAVFLQGGDLLGEKLDIPFKIRVLLANARTQRRGRFRIRKRHGHSVSAILRNKRVQGHPGAKAGSHSFFAPIHAKASVVAERGTPYRVDIHVGNTESDRDRFGDPLLFKHHMYVKKTHTVYRFFVLKRNFGSVKAYYFKIHIYSLSKITG